MIKAVFDTNVLISSVFWKGLPREVVDLAVENKIQSVSSIEILNELTRVFKNNFFDAPQQRVEAIIRLRRRLRT